MLSTQNIGTTVSALNRDFAGRRNMPGFDEQKPIHIHRRNRAFVWKKEDQERLLDSILKGYYIPPIICSHAIVNGREQMQVMDGGNRITTLRRILNNEVRDLSPDERSIVESHSIVYVIIRSMTPRQQREMFRRLNKSVKVTDGQLFAMSEEDSPLVREAVAFLEDDDYPLRQTITDLFCDTRQSDNDGKAALANAVALVSGCLNGPAYITKSFNTQEVKIEEQTPVSRQAIVSMLGKVFEVFRMANSRSPLDVRRKTKAQLTVGRLPGVILYDLHMNPDTQRQVQDKWAEFIVRARHNEEGTKQILDMRVWSANLTPDRYKRISALVDIYLRDNRVMGQEELNEIRHPHTEDFTDEEDEENDDDAASQ